MFGSIYIILVRIHNTHFKRKVFSFRFCLPSLRLEKLQVLRLNSADSESGEKKEAALLFALRDSSQQPLMQDWTVSFCTIKNHENSGGGFFFDFFWELLPPTGGCCFTASVLWNHSSPPGWAPSADWVTASSVVWCTVCSFIVKQMSLYLCFVECLLVVILSICVCVRVWGCVYVLCECGCLSATCSWILSCFCFLPRWWNCFPLIM